MKKSYNLRAIAALTLLQVIEHGVSLSQALPEAFNKTEERDKALLQELCFGTLRVLPSLEWFLQQLMSKPFTGKTRQLHTLLLVGLYQQLHTRIPNHAAVAETVEASATLGFPKLKGVINGVLRQFLRQKEQFLEQVKQQRCYHQHPEWLLKRLQKQYPESWQSITHANNQKPPMWLRVNSNFHTTESYLEQLTAVNIEAETSEETPQAVRLTVPMSVEKLPGFHEGWVTVQDSAAQQCGFYLQAQNEELILDLCAAPGGKTTHILEMAPQAQVVAVDIDAERIKKLQDNLQRLQQSAELIVADATNSKLWSKGRQFDRILLDAPCTATGVIRRHPDIKWLRQERDVNALVSLQQTLLDTAWPYLIKGGVLLYTTCSVLPEENEQQVKAFLERHSDAKLIALDEQNTHSTEQYKQVFPIENGGDGFFYAKFIKIV